MRTDSFSIQKHLPVRRFIADESKVATGLYGPCAIAEDLDNLCTMFDPEADILDGTEKGGISEKNLQNEAVTYAKLHTQVRERLHNSATSEEVETLKSSLQQELAQKAEKSESLAAYGIEDAYTKTEVDQLHEVVSGRVSAVEAEQSKKINRTEVAALLESKADKSTTLSGYGITDACTKTEVDSLIFFKTSKSYVFLTVAERDEWLSKTVNRLELKGGDLILVREEGVPDCYWFADELKPIEITSNIDLSNYYAKPEVDNLISGIDSALEEQENEISKKTETTVLYKTVVDTPVWSNQPTYSGAVAEVFQPNKVYYTTVKDADGTRLPSGQFKLMDIYGGYADAFDGVFTLSNFDTGNSGNIIENRAVEFTDDFSLRTAGVSTVDIPLNRNMDQEFRFQVTMVGEFVKTNAADYFTSCFMTNKNVSNYHSGTTTTWNGSADGYIWHYIAQGSDNSKTTQICDNFSVEKQRNGHFFTERKHLSRLTAYGTTNAKHYVGRTLGFGKAEPGTKLERVRLTSARLDGYIRNGTSIVVTEVK